jgi:L-2-hydroxyglutarate oxidase LhgO
VVNDFDLAVIGAGAVGLAVAMDAAKRGLNVIVLEMHATVGMGNSSRNSEVVHAGLYYPTGSLKHRLCVEGRRKLYGFLEHAGVPYRKCGKLVVATSEWELEAISRIFDQAQVNGVEGTKLIDAGAVARMEPEVTAVGALWSPETGIFDSHAYMVALLAQIEECGGLVAFRSQVERVEVTNCGFSVAVGGADGGTITTSRLVNSAGLLAPQIAARIDGLDPVHVPKQELAKGSYFGLNGRASFTHLVYPAPVDGGLGVHLTLDLAGRVRFGPDVEWLPAGTSPGEVDYAVDPVRAESFYAAIRRYWPGLKHGALFADYAGCRPKLSGPGDISVDFLIQSSKTHGFPGLVNLYGIESPGLTASLAIAEEVCDGVFGLD